MTSSELIGKEFKWISPITNGETFGIVDSIIADKYYNYIRVLSTNNNLYPISECTFNISDKFIEVKINE